jgi:hypothetical protein
MALKNLATGESLDFSQLPTGLVMVFTCAPDSEFAQTQLENLEARKDSLKELKCSVLFVTDDTEASSDNPNFYLDENREVVNLSERVADQDDLGENLVVLINKGGELSYGDTKEEPENEYDWMEVAEQGAKNYQETEADENGYYKWCQPVPETVEYLCVDCGYVEEFSEGSIFPICEVCIAGEPSGPSGPGEGYWEVV